MKILITGGAGFIGTNLITSLKKEYTIFSPTYKKLDITNYLVLEKYIQKHKINVVIHSAIQDDSKVFEHTMRMFASITRCLPILDKVIHFGSGAEYAKNRDLIKVKETDLGKYLPIDGYGFAKYLCSQIAKNEPKIITLRLFGVYGPHENPQIKFISNAIVKNLLKMPIKIKQNVIFDYLYIKDLIPIIEHFLLHPAKLPAYNITPDESISLLKIAKIINKISSYKSPIIVSNPGYNFQYSGANNSLKKEVKNIRLTSYEKGIKKLYSYYQKLFENIDKKAIIKDKYFNQAKKRK